MADADHPSVMVCRFLPNPTSPGSPRAPCRGEELRQLVLDKWGVSYDVTLQRRGKNMYLHVM